MHGFKGMVITHLSSGHYTIAGWNIGFGGILSVCGSSVRCTCKGVLTFSEVLSTKGKALDCVCAVFVRCDY